MCRRIKGCGDERPFFHRRTLGRLTENMFENSSSLLNPMQVPIRAVLARRAPPPNCRPERMDLTAPVEALGEEDLELGVRVPTSPDVPEDLRDVWASAPDCTAVFRRTYEGGHTPAFPPPFRGPYPNVTGDL